jgi:hypothetical protein
MTTPAAAVEALTELQALQETCGARAPRWELAMVVSTRQHVSYG